MLKTVDKIDTDHSIVVFIDSKGAKKTLEFDRLILAAGSYVVHPASVSGLSEHAFSVNHIEDAVKPDTHLHLLASLPAGTPGRNTVVVCDAGFTGVEVAAELPKRLRDILGAEASVRVVAVERYGDVGPDMGPAARPYILEAFAKPGVETRLGSAVVAVRDKGVTLASGEQIETLTAVWTAGVEGTPLVKQIPGDTDSSGRIHVDQDLRLPTVPSVLVAGDAARYG
ncbi:hypothetical protein F5Y16DRAFT_327887 [Xylariaceae sp. FL0255]|nr:hypothetical protein F5Y16DRAFT_327887 [Xylariaceae sp. FL0255]